MKQLEIDFGTYGVTREQACIMCHLSSECSGCCIKCIAEGRNGSCNGQTCSQLTRDNEGKRWETWIHLVKNNLPELRKYIPKKYKKLVR